MARPFRIERRGSIDSGTLFVVVLQDGNSPVFFELFDPAPGVLHRRVMASDIIKGQPSWRADIFD